jgi:predicted PurR-regulated permease PerM
MSPGAEREGLSSLPPTGPGSKKRRRWFLSISGLLLVAAVIAFRSVMLPFLLGLVVAYVLSPLVAAGQQLRVNGRPLPRWVVVLTMYVTLVGMLVSLISFSAPRLASELGRLSKEAPHAIATARQEWLPELNRRIREATAPFLPEVKAEPEVAQRDEFGTERPRDPSALQVRPQPDGGYSVVLPPAGIRVVPEGDRGYRIEAVGKRGKTRGDFADTITSTAARAMDNTQKTGIALLQAAQSLVGKLVRGVFDFVLTLVVSAYLLITTDRIFDFLRSLYAPGRRADFDDLVRRIDRGLSGVVRGQLIICCINGVLSGIGFYILDLKYWTFLTIVATVGSIIPIFGSILSTIPAVLVGLSQDFGTALLVLGWIVGIHQLEAHVLNPKIMGDAARVHPVLVVFALLAGEHSAGIVGALLAVPVLSITQTLFFYLRERFLGVPRNPSMPPPPLQPPPAPVPADEVTAAEALRGEPIRTEPLGSVGPQRVGR